MMLLDKKENGENRMLRNLLILMISFFVMLMVAGFLAEWLSTFCEPGSRDSLLMQSAVQAIFGFAGAAIATAILTSRNPARFLGLTSPVGIRPFIGVIIILFIGMPFMNQLIFWNSEFHLPQSMQGIEMAMREWEEMATSITSVILDTTSVGGLISGILIIGVLTAFGEELLFRGTLQRILNQNPVMHQWSIWIAAFIFSAVHLQFFGFVPRLLLGAFFGYILYSTGSIWPAIFAHAINNSIVVISEWLNQQNDVPVIADNLFVVESGFPWTPIASLFLLILFFTKFYSFFFSKKF